MYKITDSQIVGGPEWIGGERWDINTKAEHPSHLDQLHEMFRTLLSDRFKLRFHREIKELSGHVLTMDKSGSKLKLSEAKEPFEIPIKPAGRARLPALRFPCRFSWYLSLRLNSPVMDKTGLDKYYDFTLDWAPQAQSPSPELPRETREDVPFDILNGPDLLGAARHGSVATH